MKWFTPVFAGALLVSGAAMAADDAVIAEVYGQKVTVKDLQVPESAITETRALMKPEEFDAWLQDGYRQMLAFGIMAEARKRFLAEMKAEPTEEEISSYMESQRTFMAADRKRREAEVEGLREELAKTDLDEVRRKDAEEQLKLLESLAKMESQDDGSESADQGAAERSAAASVVATWKFNQALYHKYGGRVIFQQGGYEPLDANRKFVEELKTSDAYTILDPAYQDIFKETEEYFGKKHDTVDKADADKYFATPWWLQKPAAKAGS